MTVDWLERVRADIEAAHRVYLIFGEGHELLYVGMTGDIHQRIVTHKRLQPWWPEVTDIASMECEGRADALATEAALQELLRPKYSPTPSQRRARHWRRARASDPAVAPEGAR